MPRTAKARATVGRDFEIVDEVIGLFDDLRGVEEEDEPHAQSEAERHREELTARVLDTSEGVQLALAAALSIRSRKLLKGIEKGDAEASAEGAVILRALAAHSTAETVRALMDGPDLPTLLAGAESDETMPEEWDQEEEEDDPYGN